MAPRNSLTIRLSESVVFLRGSVESTVSGRRAQHDQQQQPAMLRGLLTLTLVKPTRISSIELRLEGKTTTAWPEGVGSRRLDVTEEHTILSASTQYFKADAVPGPDGLQQARMTRRTASVGPGLALDREDDSEEGPSATASADQHSDANDQRDRRRRTDARHHSLWLPTSSHRRLSTDLHNLLLPTAASISSNAPPAGAPCDEHDGIPSPPYSAPLAPESPVVATSLSEGMGISIQQQQQSTIYPPISPHPLRPSASTSTFHHSSSTHARSPTPTRLHNASYSFAAPADSSASSSALDFSLSRRTSNNDEDGDDRGDSRSRSRPPFAPPPPVPDNVGTASQGSSQNTSSANLAHTHFLPSTPMGTSTSTHGSQPAAATAGPSNTSSKPSPEREAAVRDRGRRRSRFSLATVSSAFFDAVKERVTRSRSPEQLRGRGRGRTTPGDGSPAVGVSREPSLERIAEGPERAARTERSRAEKRKSTLDKLTGAFRQHDATATAAAAEDTTTSHKTSGEGWKEFRKGTYTYPISFVIPANSPPTLHCEFGSVHYRLHATVHRPGAFTSKLVSSRDVTLIACPGEDDLEENDNIVVQREWDGQMLYMIIISGRAFPIGSTIPVQLNFMPLQKIKIFRLSAVLEERVDYNTQFKRVARTDPVKRIELLSVRYMDKDQTSLLPLFGDYPTSPLRPLVEASGADAEEAASSFMGPGPWSLQTELKLPKSCARMHFTNKHRKSNITIGHVLKITIRVERGDDEFVDAKTGRRKHFDIVVQTPLHILSCRCNPEWTMLPRYSSFASLPNSKTQTCPCSLKRAGSTIDVDQVDEPLLSASTSSHIATHATPAASGNRRRPSSSQQSSSSLLTTTDAASRPPLLNPSHSAPLANATVTHQPPARRQSDFPGPYHYANNDGTATTTTTYTPLANQDLYAYYAGSAPPPPSHTATPTPNESSEAMPMSLLYERNTQFARLVAGEESEMGEAPPKYENVVHGTTTTTTATRCATTGGDFPGAAHATATMVGEH